MPIWRICKRNQFSFLIIILKHFAHVRLVFLKYLNRIDMALPRRALRSVSPRHYSHSIDFFLPRIDGFELLVQLELLFDECILLVIPYLCNKMLSDGRWLFFDPIMLAHVQVFWISAPLLTMRHVSHVVCAQPIVCRVAVRLQMLLTTSGLHLRLTWRQRSTSNMLYVSLNILYASIGSSGFVILRMFLEVLLSHIVRSIALLLLIVHLAGIQSILRHIIVLHVMMPLHLRGIILMLSSSLLIAIHRFTRY